VALAQWEDRPRSSRVRTKMRIRTTSTAAGLPRGGVFRRRRHPTDKCAPNKMFHRGVRGRTLPRRLSRADPVADQHSQTQRSARGVESAATMITVDRGAREPPHGLPRRPVNEPTTASTGIPRSRSLCRPLIGKVLDSGRDHAPERTAAVATQLAEPGLSTCSWAIHRRCCSSS